MAHDKSEEIAFSDNEVAKLLVDHARDYAILLMSLEGRILTWSNGAERITGYPSAEAIGMHFSALFIASDRAAGHDLAELERAWRDGRAEDSRWHVRKDGSRFWANGVTMAVRGRNVLIKIIRDETVARLAEEQRTLLLNELNHRINNTLVTVQSVVEQTLRSADVDGRLRGDLTARLQALSQAHSALVEHNWAGAELSALVERALMPYRDPDLARFTVEGPPVRLSPQQAVSISLVLHELATNAVKHGALSALEGRVEVTWNWALDEVGRRRMTLLWEEHGGPLVRPPTHRGFGSRLIPRSFTEASGGEARLEYRPEGVRCLIQLKLSTDSETSILDLLAAAQGSSERGRSAPANDD